MKSMFFCGTRKKIMNHSKLKLYPHSWMEIDMPKNIV